MILQYNVLKCYGIVKTIYLCTLLYKIDLKPSLFFNEGVFELFQHPKCQTVFN